MLYVIKHTHLANAKAALEVLQLSCRFVSTDLATPHMEEAYMTVKVQIADDIPEQAKALLECYGSLS